MEAIEKDKEKNIFNTFFRCKKCLSLQKIYKTVFSRMGSPLNYIYIFAVCQNEHYEKYKIKDITELNGININLNNINCNSCGIKFYLYYCLICYKTFC